MCVLAEGLLCIFLAIAQKRCATVCLFEVIAFQMASKIIKSGGAEPDAFEKQVAQALLELEMNSDLKAQLRELHITKARELELNNKKKVCSTIDFILKSLFQVLVGFCLFVVGDHLRAHAETETIPKGASASGT